MPIYEYRCPNGHTFELFQKMSDAPAESCETCGAGPVEKVLFPVAVHYKGSGFYSTDYGRASRKGGARDGDGGGATDKGDSGGKGEKKETAKSSDAGSSSASGSSGGKSTSGD
jgi:putative FmdB family regulatory protein